MARFVQLWQTRRGVIDMLVTASREADEAREIEYGAAVAIQSWFRGCRLRAYLKYLCESATVIQKVYRGHLGRKIYRQMLKVQVATMQRNYYNTMAAKIQSRWRGYYVRRYVFDYHAQRRYLRELQRKNNIVRERLLRFRREQEREREAREEALRELKFEEEVRRQHHMMSTECNEGVYKPFRGGRSQPLPIEQRMRSLKFYSPSSKLKHRTLSCDGHVTTDTRLPPITTLPNKIQGPFRDPGTVWRQRHKPLTPTLRVATAYNSQELARAELKAREWRERVVEEEFLPFSSSSSSSSYQPLLHTTSPYSRLAYGTQHFRDDMSKTIHCREFQTVVPPVPIFDKLNSTY